MAAQTPTTQTQPDQHGTVDLQANSGGSQKPSPSDRPRDASDLPVLWLAKFKLTLLTISLCLAVFCQALDNTIIATAIPRITDEFGSLDDVGWYGSGYLLTTCAFQLSYGKLYNLFNVKWVFLVSLGIFELGSLVCGAAPTSTGLIMGRVVAGIGSGGIFAGAVLVIAALVPLDKRSIFNGLFGAMFAVASVAGPLLGGAFTEYVTWRLCFYINLPMGLITAICVLVFLRHTPAPTKASLPFKQKLREFDFIGLAVFLPAIVCLLVAVQSGGSRFSWNSPATIVLFVVAGLLFIVFIGTQIWQQDRATIPPSVVKKRTIWACSIFSFCLFGSFLAITYYIPLWFQAIKGNSATKSGINNLPSILGTVLLSMVSGGAVAALGYYTWACISASVLGAGAGLLTTFVPSTPSRLWIGYQIIYGAGVGLGLQIPLIAVQAVLPTEQVAEGTAIIIFIQTLGGSIFIAVAQNVFNSKLQANIISSGVPLDPGLVLSEGATGLVDAVPAQYLAPLRMAYNDAIVDTFYVALASACLSIVGSALIPWINLKKVKKSENAEKPGTEVLEAAEKPQRSLDGTTENGSAERDKAKEAVNTSKSESDLV
ncbi:MFS-type efflux pump MFS1 [Pseudocercospora fuligena]|uniref:MFS-type efflux pump MFS1 n=1 Tax=Pseudocercospora fuligena TaxID=685502 RepID=A0A8H6R7R1_9PEZI|nr:MFS-type efflux pump MFS1 [Pseudocercospora fuligena]